MNLTAAPRRTRRLIRRPAHSAMAMARLFLLAASTGLALSNGAIAAESSPPALQVLYLSGGGYHDYEKLVPHLTNQLGRIIRVRFQTHFGVEPLNDPNFARGYDVVLYDLCFEEAPDAALDHALAAVRGGQPAVMLHCAVHAFRRSPKLHDWETCCGMRSKVHDPYAAFTVTRLDPESPITKAFPSEWKTPGDELYQTISIQPEAHPLLRAKSVKDGREHIVCWTYQFGRGRVFATTLGHDMKTAGSPEYQRLVANGLLWACDKLASDGRPAPGYAAVNP